MSAPRDPTREGDFSVRYQEGFAAALLDPGAPTPPDLASVAGQAPDKRFAVYRNNVVVSLIDALGGGYPTVKKLVGDAFFEAMAGVFVRAHPPTSPLMMFYGVGFPDWVRAFPPAASLPYLGDVAALELARREAYHAADAPALTAEAFQNAAAALGAEALETIRIPAHPAARLIRSRYPVVSIWARNNGAETPDAAGGDALVARPDETVTVWPLEPGAVDFFEALFAGETLGAAAAHATQEAEAFDLSAALTCLLTSGAGSADVAA